MPLRLNAVCVTIAVSLGENAEKLLFLAYNIRLIRDTDYMTNVSTTLKFHFQ